MTIEELQALFRDNLLIEAIAEPFDDQGGWIIEFRHVQGGFVLLTDAQGEECHYSNLAVASKSAIEVGFKQLRVESRVN